MADAAPHSLTQGTKWVSMLEASADGKHALFIHATLLVRIFHMIYCLQMSSQPVNHSQTMTGEKSEPKEARSHL